MFPNKKENCLEVDVMKEGFQVSGENVEANSQASGNPEGFREDAEGVGAFHLSKAFLETLFHNM